jgi:hypothetical protein
MPAGEPTIAWERTSRTFSVNQGGGDFQVPMQIDKVMTWEDPVEVPAPSTWEPRPAAGYCQEYECEGDGGQSEYWNNYFSAKKDKKVKALADAIQGVGEKSAEALIAANFFQKKPRTWSAFAGEMRRAERENVISGNITYQVLEKFRADNLSRLGYEPNRCRLKDYSCTVWVDTEVLHTRIEMQTRKKVVESVQREVEVKVTNPQLQSFETESIGVEIGRSPADFSYRVGGTTRYNVTNVATEERLSLQFQGVERIPQDLPNDAMLRSSFVEITGGGRFTVNVEPKYVPTQAPDTLIFSYYVQTCKKNWTGICFGDWQNGPRQEVAFKGSSITTDIKVEKKQKARIMYTILRKNSRWYNDKPLRDRESDKISL